MEIMVLTIAVITAFFVIGALVFNFRHKEDEDD